MSVSPEQMLARAQEQLQSSDELNFREATKNAYYAAYHLLKPFEAAIDDPRIYSKSSHAQLIAVLGNHRAAPIKALGFMLRDCRTRRNVADYDIESEFFKETAKTQIEMAVRIFAKYREVIDSGIICLGS